jgi:hypothetical protein
LPAGQGAVFLLTTGFVGESAGSITLAIAVTGAYIVVFIMALIVSVMVSGAGPGWGIAFMSFFVLTQATRFPVFGAETDNAGLLTLAALARAVVEVGILTWLARRLVEAAEDQSTGVVFSILALTFAHGILAGWEEPMIRGALTITNYGAQAGWWFALTGLQLAAAFVFIRIRRSWFQEPTWAEPVPVPEAEAKPIDPKGFQATIVDLPPEPVPRRSRPRRPRRR